MAVGIAHHLVVAGVIQKIGTAPTVVFVIAGAATVAPVIAAIATAAAAIATAEKPE
jgi:hypothetical protein